MTKYQPSVGQDFSVVEQRHRHRISYFTLAFGAALTTAIVVLIAFNVQIDGRREGLLSAVLAFGLASTSHGLAGGLSVRFRHAGLFAQGTLAGGVFILVLVFTTVLNCKC